MKTHVIGYKWLQRLIGILGTSFSLGLLVTVLIGGGPVPGSISAYYYVPGLCRSIFDVSLGAIAVFLFCYRGYDRDYIPMKIAAVAMIGVIVCPTPPANPTTLNIVLGVFHGLFAATTFFTLSIISFFLFTKTQKTPLVRTIQTDSTFIDKSEHPVSVRNNEILKIKGSRKGSYATVVTLKKLERNRIYRTCGIIMWAAMAGIGVLNFWLHVPFSMYVCETIIVAAFGLSWLVKGESIPVLNDK